MRDGNIQSSSIDPSGTIVFSLPMRDGNACVVWYSYRISCEFLVFLWGMETFYAHHLLVAFRSPFLVFLWGMETLSSQTWSWCSFLVFSLPMRDGNLIRLMAPFGTLPSFLVFLWGMETPLIMWRFCITAKVFSLPMRDGNMNSSGTGWMKT